MTNYNELRYAVLLGGHEDAPEAGGAVQAVGLPPLQKVATTGFNPKTGKNEFKTLGVQYHMYPEFPDQNIIADWVALLKAQMDGQAANMTSLTIMVGTGPNDTGWYMLTPYQGDQLLKTNVSHYIKTAEFKGQDAALSDFRKSLEGKGLL